MGLLNLPGVSNNVKNKELNDCRKEVIILIMTLFSLTTDLYQGGNYCDVIV